MLTKDPCSPIYPAMLFSFLDEVMGGENVEIDRDRVDHQLMDQLSDLGATWELLIAVRPQRPRAQEILTDESLLVSRKLQSCLDPPFGNIWSSQARPDARAHVHAEGRISAATA